MIFITGSLPRQQARRQPAPHRNRLGRCISRQLTWPTVLHDGAAEAGAELVQAEGRQGGAVERRARIQLVVAHVVERAAVVFVGSGLGNHADLRAAGGSGLGGVVRSADAKFGDGVERDVQPRVRLLRLFLHAAGIDAVEHEVAVVERVAVELDGALPAVASS